ncbi:MAG: Uma2 family endonuclease [Cyclobacteriaceae bacterium]
MAKTLTTPGEKKQQVPRTFVYEEIDGIPVYYQGYKKALANHQPAESIMGSSELQATLTSIILEYLYTNLDKRSYRIVTGEAGLHLEGKTNLSADIAIYDKEILKDRKLQKKYFDIPPLVNIEVDTQADLQDFPAGTDYYHLKTQKLLDFGVQQVIWFFTPSRKMMVAQSGQAWLTTDWNEPVKLLEKYTFSLQALLQQEDIQLD